MRSGRDECNAPRVEGTHLLRGMRARLCPRAARRHIITHCTHTRARTHVTNVGREDRERETHREFKSVEKKSQTRLNVAGRPTIFFFSLRYAQRSIRAARDACVCRIRRRVENTERKSDCLVHGAARRGGKYIPTTMSTINASS